MGRKKKNANPRDYLTIPSLEINEHAKRSIFIVFLLVFGLISLLGLFNLSGHFGTFISKTLTIVFGYGKWLAPFILLYWALILIRQKKNPLKFSDYLGLGLLFISYQTLFHFFIDPLTWKVSVAEGVGGGYIGYYLSQAFYYIFGFWGGVIVLIALLLISLVLVFNTSLARILGRESLFAKVLNPFAMFFHNLFASSDDENKSGAEFIKEARENILGTWQKKELSDDISTDLSADIINNVSRANKNSAHQGDEDDFEEEVDEKIKARKKEKAVQEKIVWPKKTFKIDLPIELLNNKVTKPHGGDTEINAQKIKSTLDKFGIEVEMGETKVGPTVTQYTFRPAEGVKLSRITTLNNDLSLSLAAHPIRIEAPIPGKSLVGVEVPNRAKAIVGLREILEDEAFKTRKNNLFLVLGKDVAGIAWLYDITRMPHLLVAGATNSGKSVCLNAIIVGLLYQNNPADLRFIMVDPKRVELPVYNGIPHLLTPVITDVNKTINALKWCLNEMDRRYDVLNKAGKKNIQAYNQIASEKLPYIVFIIDELADFMMTSGKEMEAAIIRLAQMSRAIGIHLILATQRPSVDVITGLIKANIPTRIAFSVASLVDSKTILDISGAEKLLGQGDMLFMTPELSKPKRIQGAYLSDSEINDVVNYIKEKCGPAEYLEGVTDRQKVSGNAGVGMDGTHGDEDELFEEAKEIIVKANKASTSMLQRRLSIGYGRAAKMLDQLEEAGIIGPSNGSKPREVFLSRDQYEAMGPNVISGIPIHERSSQAAPSEYFSPVAENNGDDDEEGNDDTLVFESELKNSQAEKITETPEVEEETEEEISEAESEEIKEELELSPTEEDAVIEDENEILESIREEKKERIKKPIETDTKKAVEVKKTPADDDDEMFFAR